jgi:hypothetical protein
MHPLFPFFLLLAGIMVVWGGLLSQATILNIIYLALGVLSWFFYTPIKVVLSALGLDFIFDYLPEFQSPDVFPDVFNRIVYSIVGLIVARAMVRGLHLRKRTRVSKSPQFSSRNSVLFVCNFWKM